MTLEQQIQQGFNKINSFGLKSFSIKLPFYQSELNENEFNLAQNLGLSVKYEPKIDFVFSNGRYMPVKDTIAILELTEGGICSGN